MSCMFKHGKSPASEVSTSTSPAVQNRLMLTQEINAQFSLSTRQRCKDSFWISSTWKEFSQKVSFQSPKTAFECGRKAKTHKTSVFQKIPVHMRTMLQTAAFSCTNTKINETHLSAWPLSALLYYTYWSPWYVFAIFLHALSWNVFWSYVCCPWCHLLTCTCIAKACGHLNFTPRVIVEFRITKLSALIRGCNGVYSSGKAFHQRLAAGSHSQSATRALVRMATDVGRWGLALSQHSSSTQRASGQGFVLARTKEKTFPKVWLEEPQNKRISKIPQILACYVLALIWTGPWTVYVDIIKINLCTQRNLAKMQTE